MSETEDPVVTVARLLRTKMRVAKDSGALASVNVSGEWQNYDAFKSGDGQVTVGLAECADQKIELTGKIRRRMSAIRVNVWTTDMPNATEGGKAMRGKIVEEVNRIVRQNRSKPNETIYDFVGAGSSGQGCRAFSSDIEAAPSADWAELPAVDYQKLWYSDDNRCQVSISERIESSEYSKDILRIRNRISVYGVTDKSVPADKDLWTESLAPSDGAWIATSGTISLDSALKVKGSNSIKTSAQNFYYVACQLTLNSGKEADADLYPTLNLWLSQDTSFNGNTTITLDTDNNAATHEITVGTEKWFQTQIPVGTTNADSWQTPTQFNWHQINRVQVTCWFDSVGTGNFWVDGLFFGGNQYSSTQDDQVSQNSIGLRELVEVNEELCSDLECESHAKALLTNLKDPAEKLIVQSTVIDYGTSPILGGDKIRITLPNESINADFRVLSAEYHVDGKTQVLETTLELGREKPLLADYVYALRSKTDRLSRYKTAKH